MTAEALFQKNIIDALRLEGIKALHLSPPSHPGFPDLLCTLVDRFMMVELKVIDSINDTAMRSMFTKAQLPWIYNWLNEDGAPIVIIVKIKETGTYFVILVIDKQDAVKLMSQTVRESFNLSVGFHFDSIGCVAGSVAGTMYSFIERDTHGED